MSSGLDVEKINSEMKEFSVQKQNNNEENNENEKDQAKIAKE